jgi:hypothetical protein
MSPHNVKGRALQDWCGMLRNLSTLLHQGIEGGLEDVALVEVVYIVARVSTLHA